MKVVHYDETGNITKSEVLASLTINDWSETPFRLSSANVRAEYLSVPELRDYLKFNSDFPETLLAPFATHLQYRMALPWTCLVIAFIAAPLGIGYSRRGLLSSVATAIILVFAMNFVTHLFLALGEGARIPDLGGGVGAKHPLRRAGPGPPLLPRDEPGTPAAEPFGEGRMIAR